MLCFLFALDLAVTQSVKLFYTIGEAPKSSDVSNDQEPGRNENSSHTFNETLMARTLARAFEELKEKENNQTATKQRRKKNHERPRTSSK